MPLNIRESLPLSRFIYEPNWTPLKGMYVLPLRFFGSDRTVDPNDYLEVVRVVSVSGTDVAVTRGGGLFVRDRGQYKSRGAIDDLAGTFNFLLAEFALQGLASHPVTDVEIQDAKLIGRHASITGGWGSFADRTWGPYVLLASPKRDLGVPYGQPGNDYWPVNFYWTPHDPRILDRVADLGGATRLREFSPTLPTLFVAAVYHAARHDLAESIVTAWIVCEELVSFLWDEYVSSLPEKDRRDRLNDNRTYSVSVQLEVLLTVAVITSQLYKLLHDARKVRNDLAHRALMGQDAAATSSRAMREILRHAGVSVDHLPGYSFSSGSIGAPRVALEPDFDFK